MMVGVRGGIRVRNKNTRWILLAAVNTQIRWRISRNWTRIIKRSPRSPVTGAKNEQDNFLEIEGCIFELRHCKYVYVIITGTLPLLFVPVAKSYQEL